MADIDEIANRIADVILSPESVTGLIHGVLSVPMDIGYLAYGYLHTESRYSHQTERVRIVKAIRNRILDYDRIIDAINLVLGVFNNYVNEAEQNKIYSRTVSSVLGRITTNSLISSRIAAAIAGQASIFVAFRGGAVGNILLAGGMAERCIITSERLRIEDPEVYGLLRPRDYDLLYFLFEPVLKPFIDALNVRRVEGLPAFNRVLSLVEAKLNGFI